jgi:hypothetical protein
VQKALQDQLEYKNKMEHQQLCETLLHKYYYGQETYTPCTVQILFSSLHLGIEYYALNLNSDRRKESLQKLLKCADSIFRVFLVSLENARERDYLENNEYQINGIILTHLHFLFDVRRHIPPEESEDVANLLRDAVTYSFKFMIILIEVENQKIGTKASYHDMILELFTISSIPPFKMFVAKLFEIYFFREKGHIIEMKEIKNLKVN